MKEKMRKSPQIRHEIGSYGKIERSVQKSFNKEASHKIESKSSSGGIFTAIKRMLSKFKNFFGRGVRKHNGTGTKQACKKFGGAFGGGVNRNKYQEDKGRVGNKLRKRILSNR